MSDTNTDSAGYIGPSERLTPELLERIRDGLPEEQYRWLFVSVWFGLRPKEIMNLTLKKTSYRIETESDAGVPVLMVFQSKLIAVEREKKWKLIPAILSEQVTALQYIREGKLKSPLTRRLKKLTGSQTTLYGGRKGFTDLMLNLGQKLEDISSWLGHQSIEMTWRRYRNKRRVSFTPVSASQRIRKAI